MCGITLLTRERLQDKLLNITSFRSRVGFTPQLQGFQICGTVPSEINLFALDLDLSIRSAVHAAQALISPTSVDDVTRNWLPLLPGTLLCPGLPSWSTFLCLLRMSFAFDYAQYCCALAQKLCVFVRSPSLLPRMKLSANKVTEAERMNEWKSCWRNGTSQASMTFLRRSSQDQKAQLGRSGNWRHFCWMCCHLAACGGCLCLLEESIVTALWQERTSEGRSVYGDGICAFAACLFCNPIYQRET